MSQNFNIAPYYDDFDDTKQFYRVLFRPGVAVQTREVNQLQSILQDQVTKLGDHLFKEGSMVIPGQVNYNDKLNYVKIASTALGNWTLTELEDKFISNTTDGSGVIAQVLKAIPATTTDPITLVVLYTKSNQTAGGLADVQFSPNSTLYVVDDVTRTINAAGSLDVTGRSVAAGLQSGVYFLGGYLVSVPSSVLSVKTYATDVSDINARIGIKYTETIVTPDDDISLYDNAAGSPNAAAPGAHRYKITTEFIQIGLDETPLNFFELIRVENGVLQSIVNASQYNILEDTLARRTFDESGNYVVDDFKFEIREARNSDRGNWSNSVYLVNDIVQATGGRYFRCINAGQSGNTEPAQFNDASTDETTVISDGTGVIWRLEPAPTSNRGLNLTGSPDNLVANFGIGKAYVNGREISKLAVSNITIPKSRATKSLNNQSINISQGNYVFLDRNNIAGAPNISAGPEVQLFDRFAHRGSGPKFGLGAQVGTARLGWTEPDSRGFIRASLNNIVMNPGKTFGRDVKSVVAPDSTTGVSTTSYTLSGNVKYAGPAATHLAITGNITASSQATTLVAVTGISTTFTTELRVGDVITVGTSSYAATRQWSVVAITSNTQMLLTGFPSPTNWEGTLTTSALVGVDAFTVLGMNGTRFDAEYRIGDRIFLGPTNTSNTVIGIRDFGRMQVSSNLAISITNTSHGTVYSNRNAAFTGDVGGSYQSGINSRKLTGEFILQDFTGGTGLVPAHQALRITGSNDAKLVSELTVNDYVNINNQRLLVTKISSNTVAFAISLEAAITGSNTAFPAFQITNAINDAENNTLLFNVAPSSVSSITDNVYAVYKTQSVSVTPGGNQATVTLANASGNNAAESLATTDPGSFYIAEDTPATLGAPRSVTAVAVAGNNVTLTVSGTFASGSVRVIYPVNRAAASANALGHLKTKTLQLSYGDEFLSTSSAVRSRIPLAQADVLRVVKVFMASSFVGSWNSTVQSNATDVSNRYELDNGQRDQFYDVGTLVLRPGYPKPTGSIKVFYDYFEHSAGDFCTRNSYDPNVIPFEEIPTYGDIRLSDVLDFRPKVNASTGQLINSAPPRFGSNFVADISYFLGRKEKIFLDANGSFYNVSGTSDLAPLAPTIAEEDNSIQLYDVELKPYTFTSRFPDVITKKYDNRRYTMRDIGKIERRVANIEETTALSLLETRAQGLQIRDNLDSSLERFKTGFFVDTFEDQSNTDITSDGRISIDEDAKTLNPDIEYASIPLIEKMNYVASPFTSSEAVAAVPYRQAENYAITGDLLTLDYTTSTVLSQTLATTSIAVAPFVVASFLGSLRVVPDKDVYENIFNVNAIVQRIDNRTPEKLAEVIAAYRATGDRRRMAIGAVEYLDKLSVTKTPVEIPFCRANTVLLIAKGLKPNHKFYPFFDDRDIRQLTTGAVKFTFQQMPLLDFSSPTPRGKNESARWRSLAQSVKVSEFNSVRSYYNYYKKYKSTYDTQWTNQTLFPKSLDATLPSSVYRDAYRVALGQGYSVYYYEGGRLQGSGVVVHQDGTTLYLVNARGKLSQEFVDTQVTKSYNYGNGVFYVSAEASDPKYVTTPTVTLASMRTNDDQGNLYSDRAGVVVCLFDLPETDTLAFISGQKPVAITDDPDNHPDDWSSKADGNYFHEGFDTTFTHNYRSTLNYIVRPYDPIAQSFKLPSQFTNGAFITDIDVFFQAKPVTELAPVALEMRTCDITGRPSATEMVPGTEVTLMPDQVNVDATQGLIPTKFKFRQPVYLLPEKQYAFVLRTDTKNYRVWMATMGQQDVADPSKSYTTQAMFGSMFKSQDGTLWTEDQTSDLKFVINRAVFNTADVGARVHVVNQNVPAAKLPSNPFTFVQGSTKIRVSQENHGLRAGDLIRFYSPIYNAAYIADNTAKMQGVPLGEIFGAYGTTAESQYYEELKSQPKLVVSEVTLDSYVVTVTTPANIAGGVDGLTYAIDGGVDITAQRNIQAHVVRPLVSALTFQPTQLSMEAIMTKGITYDTDANDGAAYSRYTRELSLNNYNILDTSSSILAKTVEEETSRLPTVKVTAGVGAGGLPLDGVDWDDSFIGVIRMSTETDHVSPAISMNTFYLNTMMYKIDNPSRESRLPVELSSNGTTSLSILVTTITESSTVISFDNTSQRIVSENIGEFADVVPGRYITVTGSSQDGNNFTTSGLLVVSVEPDGRSMTVSSALVTRGIGDGITIRQIDIFTDEATTNNGSANSKYITRVINLQNPATQIKFQIEACVPSAADFDLYYKTGAAGSDFNNINWVKYVAPNQTITTSSYTNLVKSDARNNFTDVELSITDYDDIGNPIDLASFTAFQIKLVMRSSNAARVAQFRNLRLIAHA